MQSMQDLMDERALFHPPRQERVDVRRPSAGPSETPKHPRRIQFADRYGRSTLLSHDQTDRPLEAEHLLVQSSLDEQISEGVEQDARDPARELTPPEVIEQLPSVQGD